jgi:hypothetical protein
MIKVILEASTEQELQKKIDAYLNNYHPAGYGTWVRRRYEENGMYKAEITRASSCD